MHEEFETLLKKVPEAVKPMLRRAWEDYRQAIKQHYSKMPEHIDFLPSLIRVWTGSDFVIKNCIRHPNVIVDLFESGDIFLEYYPGDYNKRLKSIVANPKSIKELQTSLRHFRRREMIRIAWRDLARWTKTIRTMNELSSLADTIITVTRDIIFDWHCRQYGTPTNAAGETLPFLVIAMGKLGASELNFSSDVDLIYTYPEDGQIEDSISYHEFFRKIARQFTQALDNITVDGFVFRVDLRLRPYGNSGMLCNSFQSLLNYYKQYGREWERYALVKARIINPDKEFSPIFMRAIRDFVYRQYLDYSAIEELRKLQTKITLEVKKKGLEGNIKRGPGGIREIEFIGQTHKIIRGGRYPRLQRRNTLKTFILLRETECLSEKSVKKISQAYLFLRTVENKLQIFNDQQTHTLPTTTIEQQRLAKAMGYITWRNFMLALNKHKSVVQKYFSRLIAQPKMEFSEKSERKLECELKKYWETLSEESSNPSLLQNIGFNDPASIKSTLLKLSQYTDRQNLGKLASSNLDNLLPHLLMIVGRQNDPDKLLMRIIPLIERIIEKSFYIILFIENPIALSQAVNLCSASSLIAEQFIRYPLLLDELLAPETLTSLPTLRALKKSLKDRLHTILYEDIDEKIKIIRQFRQVHMLRVAVADVSGMLPIMKVSDYLTNIATVVVDGLRELLLADLIEKHGEPQLTRRDKAYGFCIIAYGKMGGKELGFGSDLDLVYLYPNLNEQAYTQGKTPISNQQFFVRLGQQLTNTLNKTDANGFLYHADLRLRPSGDSGLLATSLSAFANYQKERAWSWEHQALVRARPISGSKIVAHYFNKIRNKILKEPRDTDKLQQSVVDMREKMRDNKLQHQDGYFDLKQGPGGLVDIEFLSQYIVLRWSPNYPSLLEYTDNIRILERASMESLIHVKDVKTLIESYKIYRNHIHKLSLQKRTALISDEKFQFNRVAVLRLWQQLLANDTQTLNTEKVQK